MKPGLVIALAMSALLASASGGRAQTKPASETRSGSSAGGVQAANPFSVPPAVRRLAPGEIEQAMTAYRQAQTLTEAGAFAEAEALYRLAAGIFIDSYGADHPITLEIVGPLIGNLMTQGKAEEAAEMQERALGGLSAFYGEDSEQAVTARRRLAMAYLRTETSIRAEPVIRRLIAAQADDPQWTAINFVTLGQMLNTANRPQEAEQALRQALTLIDGGKVEPRLAPSARAQLADSLKLQRRFDEAGAELRRAIEERGFGPGGAEAGNVFAVDWYVTLADILDSSVQGASENSLAVWREAGRRAAARQAGVADRSRRREQAGFAHVFQTLVARAWARAEAVGSAADGA